MFGTDGGRPGYYTVMATARTNGVMERITAAGIARESLDDSHAEQYWKVGDLEFRVQDAFVPHTVDGSYQQNYPREIGDPFLK